MSSRYIGTWHETSLHRDLKYVYAGPDGQIEAEIGGFVADAVDAQGEFIEIQTGSFAPLRNKAQELTARGGMRIVYPVVAVKYIELYAADGSHLSRRKSSKHGTYWDIFNPLIYAPELPLIPRLVIELALVEVSEQRIQDGKGSWRRKGVSIQDRGLITLHERVSLERPADYLRFIPFEKDEPFTSALLGEKAGIRTGLARKALYVLSRIGVIEKTGKQANTLVYRIVPQKTHRTAR